MPTSLLPLLASITLLLPAAEAALPTGPVLPDPDEWQWSVMAVPDEPDQPAGEAAAPTIRFLMETWDPGSAAQVRIEQRLIIRIAPRGPAPDFFTAPPRIQGPRFYERKTNRCQAVQGIAGVQVVDDRLVLVMRDRRLIGATLERSCRPRDFYSGFYLEHSTDGMLCAGRDDIHSRAGVTCGVTAMRELIPND